MANVKIYTVFSTELLCFARGDLFFIVVVSPPPPAPPSVPALVSGAGAPLALLSYNARHRLQAGKQGNKTSK